MAAPPRTPERQVGLTRRTILRLLGQRLSRQLVSRSTIDNAGREHGLQSTLVPSVVGFELGTFRSGIPMHRFAQILARTLVGGTCSYLRGRAPTNDGRNCVGSVSCSLWQVVSNPIAAKEVVTRAFNGRPE